LTEQTKEFQMIRYSLALAASLCLAFSGCKHTLGHYPSIDDGANMPSALPEGPVARNAQTPVEPRENVPTPEPTRPRTTGNAPERTLPDASPETPAVRLRPATRPSISKLYGVAVRASHIVYVIDRSATTNKYWDDLRTEIVSSLGDLYMQQDFTVILMGEGRARIGPGNGLITASKHNQMLAAKMLLETAATGKTDPLPALRLAINTLAAADNKPGKVLYFVTDRAMTDTAAVTLFQTTPGAKDIVVMTYMVGQGGGDTQRVLEKLASQSGGRFTHVAQPSGE
jgi:hypothetical protein